MSDEPRVDVQENGPYIVSGDVPLVRRDAVESEGGERLSWGPAEPMANDHSPYALCRCGKSANRPFCDGTHKGVGFDGTEGAPTDTAADRTREFPGEGMTLLDDKPVCIHAGFCGAGGTYVWDLMEETADTSKRALAMAMTERCPSGRLRYTTPDSDTPVEPAVPVQAGIVPGGPIWLTGGVPVERADGEPLETRQRMTLCRCGASKIKPLCDGSHADIDFEADD
jgi:CDGSH-type Zn-finger protein